MWTLLTGRCYWVQTMALPLTRHETTIPPAPQQWLYVSEQEGHTKMPAGVTQPVHNSPNYITPPTSGSRSVQRGLS